ncbi:MAG TPA: hypothetical protein VEX68_25720 [Bryobacteraceae bacterium]|nr:hypothetical protein [Bryobacteraceae bacterium]
MRLLISLVVTTMLGEAQTPIRTPVTCTLATVQKLDLSCSLEDPCPLYLELSDAETVGTRIVIAGNIHTPSQTLESLLLVSDDGGKTWVDGHTRLLGGSLTDIQFIDFEVGWVSGHLLQPDARDPFFLITSDGGKTWRRRAVYSERKTGAIEQFRFDSRTSGKMTIDRGQPGENGLRYELWESLTGGDSWSIRQVDARPIPFPGAQPATKPLRIRADAPTKTYRLEKQEDAQWRAVASFLVALGECKPEPPAIVEPTPPPAEPAPAPASPKTPPSLKGKKPNP